MRILIREDEKLLADSLKALLEQNGFEADAACDGKTGEYYAALGIYDLLILDVMMPERDGYEVARRLRERRMEMPILMLTARSELDDRVTGLNAGADYYLTKPFDNLAYAFSFILLLAIAAVCFIDSSKFEGLLPRIMEKLSLFERFYAFVNGVFDMTAIVYFLSVIVFFLFLSVQSLEKRRYN